VTKRGTNFFPMVLSNYFLNSSLHTGGGGGGLEVGRSKDKKTDNGVKSFSRGRVYVYFFITAVQTLLCRQSFFVHSLFVYW
jgi:hypothetical protein